MSKSVEAGATPATNIIFGAFFLALDRMQHLPASDGTGEEEGVAMADPAAVECVMRHWTLGDSRALEASCRASGEFNVDVVDG